MEFTENKANRRSDQWAIFLVLWLLRTLASVEVVWRQEGKHTSQWMSTADQQTKLADEQRAPSTADETILLISY
jgi:hypothetical protein